MTIRTRIRTLAAAALLALAVVSVSAGRVHAKPKHPGNGVHCAAAGPTVGEDDEDWVFFLPGDEIVAYDSADHPHTLRCGADGKWHEVRRVTPAAGGAVGPRRLVIAP